MPHKKENKQLMSLVYPKNQSVNQTDKNKTKRKLRKIDKEKLNQLVLQGNSDKQIAEIFGVNERTIFRKRKKFNIPPGKSRGGNRREKVIDEKKLKLLISQNKSDEEIAKELGVSRSTVFKVRKKNGIVPPNGHGGKRKSAGRPKADEQLLHNEKLYMEYQQRIDAVYNSIDAGLRVGGPNICGQDWFLYCRSIYTFNKTKTKYVVKKPEDWTNGMPKQIPVKIKNNEKKDKKDTAIAWSGVNRI